ncbi:MAG TPA: hypothetical protein VGJ74_10610 [Burkholderiales bacterium]|jgi:hypothetical protein
MKYVRIGVLGFAVAVNAVALYALHVAMGEGTERARLANIEPPQVIVSAPKDGPALASTQVFVP